MVAAITTGRQVTCRRQFRVRRLLVVITPKITTDEPNDKLLGHPLNHLRMAEEPVGLTMDLRIVWVMVQQLSELFRLTEKLQQTISHQINTMRRPNPLWLMFIHLLRATNHLRPESIRLRSSMEDQRLFESRILKM